MKKAVVTGGAGFIGSHLAEKLAGQGYRVVILDDLSTGKKENIQGLPDSVELVQGSVTDPALVGEVLAGADFVFHLAAIPSVPRSIDNPLATHNVNVNGTLNVLLAARQNKVGKLVYSSSSSVYGDTPTLPKKEEMAPHPLSPYAVSKLTGEYYCRVFTGVFGLPTMCLRYFNVYGPRQDPASQYAAAIPKFIRQVTGEKPVTIYGDGEQTRDFTFVRDVVAANIKAAESGATGLFNIGSGQRTSVNRLVELIGRITGKKYAVAYEPARPGDVKHSLADISAAGAFGYRPEYKLKEGLAETIEWFNEK